MVNIKATVTDIAKVIDDMMITRSPSDVTLLDLNYKIYL